MNFGKIDHIVLLGGARLLAEFAPHVKKQFQTTAFIAPRHFSEKVSDSETLGDSIKRNQIPFLIIDDINKRPEAEKAITSRTLGIGLGPAWEFKKDIIDKFGGKLVNFMGIRLPRYRGGAHYTWQILRGNKVGACNLQIIKENIDSGEVIKNEEYALPSTARIPRDYFDVAMVEEISFLNKFLAEVKAQKDFSLTKLDESTAEYYPFLSTVNQAFIDWNWSGGDIAKFICAFDEPYAGASTFIDGKLIRLKNCTLDKNEKPFHPFASGVIFRKWGNALYVATTQGALIVRGIFDETGKDLMQSIAVGQRIYTPLKFLDEAMRFSVVYDSKGLKPSKKLRKEE